jgi:hypothetical protein
MRIAVGSDHAGYVPKRSLSAHRIEAIAVLEAH